MKILFIILMGIVSGIHTYGQNFTTPDSVKQKVHLSNGIPGPATSIRIRCSPTITTSNQPLYILDGVLVENTILQTINPKDIECIDVLKTPFAQTIYGCRAIHGVILITTKQAGMQKLKVMDARNRVGVPGATISFQKKNTIQSQTIAVNETGETSYKLSSVNFDSVIVSSIGYETKRMRFQDLKQSQYKIFLTPSVKELQEVCVVGYPYRRLRCGIGYIKIYNFFTSPDTINLQQSIRLFPNPVSTNRTVQLSFSNLSSGLYQIRIVNEAGQLFYAYQKQISSKNETEQIHLNERMTPGLYIVQIINDKKKLVQSLKMVVQ